MSRTERHGTPWVGWVDPDAPTRDGFARRTPADRAALAADRRRFRRVARRALAAGDWESCTRDRRTNPRDLPSW